MSSRRSNISDSSRSKAPDSSSSSGEQGRSNSAHQAFPGKNRKAQTPLGKEAGAGHHLGLHLAGVTPVVGLPPEGGARGVNRCLRRGRRARDGLGQPELPAQSYHDENLSVSTPCSVRLNVSPMCECTPPHHRVKNLPGCNPPQQFGNRLPTWTRSLFPLRSSDKLSTDVSSTLANAQGTAHRCDPHSNLPCPKPSNCARIFIKSAQDNSKPTTSLRSCLGTTNMLPTFKYFDDHKRCTGHTRFVMLHAFLQKHSASSIDEYYKLPEDVLEKRWIYVTRVNEHLTIRFQILKDVLGDSKDT